MNDDTERQKILERVRKLLALSTSSNENEAAAAAEKAQAILAEYNLTMAEVRKLDDKPLDFEIDSTEETDSRPWRRNVAYMAAQLYFCKYYFTFTYTPTATRKNGRIRSDVHNFVGEKHNVVVAKMLFLFLTATIDRLAVDGASRQPPRSRTSYMTSFRHAASNRVCLRLQDRLRAAKEGQVKSESTGKNLPALLDLYKKAEIELGEFVKKKLGTELSTHKARTGMNNMDGLRDGREAGDKIGLDPQLNDKAGANRLEHLQ